MPEVEHRNHGLLLLPPEGDGPSPLLVDVHGGPHSYVELGYPHHLYWFALAPAGWAVSSINPVGSASYGKEHSAETGRPSHGVDYNHRIVTWAQKHATKGERDGG